MSTAVARVRGALPERLPPCPGHLTAAAAKEWRRVAKALHGMGVVTAIDRAAQRGQAHVHQRVTVTLEQRALDELEVSLELDHRRVRRRTRQLVPQRLCAGEPSQRPREPRVEMRERAAVGLVSAML